jgi:glyoxylase-like metal-dependent hydrolase (beta-lactamase superfamily II)
LARPSQIVEDARVDQIAPRLRRWTAWHEEWRQEVASLAVDTPDGLVLVDPIDPPPEVRSPAHVLLTVFWHARNGGDLESPRYWAHSRGVRRLKNRGVTVTDDIDGDEPLPGGIEAFDTARESEVVYWLPEQRAIAVGDVLLGAGAKPHATSEPLRLCPERWLDKKKHRDLKKSLRPLLDLPLERILVSHGEPILTEAKDVLGELLDRR